MLYLGETYDKKRLITDIIISFISFVLLILSAVAINRYDIKDRIIEDILTNWKSHLIYKITEMTDSCPKDSRELIIDRFQGTKEGCNCLGRSGNLITKQTTDRINPYPCSYDLLNSNCYTVLPISPKTMKIWQTKILCIQQTNLTFYEHIRSAVNSKDDCPNGYVLCGQLDSMQNRLCVPSNDLCPINKIIISKYTVPSDYTYQTIQITDELIIHYTTEGDNETIPVELTIVEGNKCIDPNEKNTRFDPYVLINQNKSYYCSVYNKTLKYDNRYIKLDSMATRELLDQNGLLTPLLNLPHYPKEQLDSVTSLFSRTYIGWNITCLTQDQTSPEYLRNVTEIIDHVNKINISLLVVVALSFVYLLVISLFYKRLFPKDLFYLNVSNGISIVLFVIILGISIFGFIVISEIDFSIFTCGDTLTTYFFDSLGTRLQYTKIVYLIIAICVFGFSIAYVTVFIIGVINTGTKKLIPVNVIKEIPSGDLTNGLPNKKEKNEEGIFGDSYRHKFRVPVNKEGMEENDSLKKHRDEMNSSRLKQKEEEMKKKIGSRFRKDENKPTEDDGEDKWRTQRNPKSERNIVEYK